MVDVANGQQRIRAWPRARGKKATPEQKAQQEWFRQASWAIKFFEPTMMSQIMQARVGKPILPRDLGMMMLSGRLLAFTNQDGRRVYPLVAVTDVSESLDVITQLPGYMLIRGADRWEGTPAPIGGNMWWFQPPDASGWTDRVGAAPNVVKSYDTQTGLFCNFGQGAATRNIRAIVRTIPFPASAWSVEFACTPMIPQITTRSIGVILRNTSNGRIYVFGQGDTGVWNIITATSLTATPTVVSTRVFAPGATPQQTRIISNGTTISFDISPDGKNWVALYSTLLSTWISNANLEIGIAGHLLSAGAPDLTLTCTRWKTSW